MKTVFPLCNRLDTAVKSYARQDFSCLQALFKPAGIIWLVGLLYVQDLGHLPVFGSETLSAIANPHIILLWAKGPVNAKSDIPESIIPFTTGIPAVVQNQRDVGGVDLVFVPRFPFLSSMDAGVHIPQPTTAPQIVALPIFLKHPV